VAKINLYARTKLTETKIAIYADGDPNIWIPVSSRSPTNEARAFLPFRGLDGTYTHSFKAEPAADRYFVALAAIQKAWKEDITKSFLGKKGKEIQRADKWRHGNATGSPLLGPTAGWIEIPTTEIETVSAEQLTSELEQSGKRVVSSVRTCVDPAGNLFRQISAEARTFQIAFRRNAMMLWGTKCAISGATCLLEAAHLKSVASCKTNDLLALTDPLNSIILNIALHALLDDGLIAFSNTGALLVSSRLTPTDRKAYGVDESMVVRFDPRALKYVEHHRESTFIA
jgi:hypothetical protein